MRICWHESSGIYPGKQGGATGMVKKESGIIPPQRMNIFGRKRYSVETNAADYENFHFDDIWKAIGRLWVAIALLLAIQISMKKGEK